MISYTIYKISYMLYIIYKISILCKIDILYIILDI